MLYLILFVYQLTELMSYQSIQVKLIVRKQTVSLSINVINIVNKLTIDDIDLFVKPSKGRDRNDCNNKKREMILGILPDLVNHTEYQQFLQDDRWKLVHKKFLNILTSLAKGKEFDKIHIEQKAGRSNNFDFQVSFFKNNTLVHSIDELEFKNGSDKITTRVPQQLSLQTNSAYGSFIDGISPYEEYFYHNYLSKVVKCYEKGGVCLPCLPSFEEYSKLVRSVNYIVHPVFNAMKENESVVSSEKSRIIDESIDKYLGQITKEHINFEMIQSKLQHSQGNKTFILWDTKDFYVDYIEKKELTLNQQFDFKTGRNKLVHTLVLHTEDPHKSWELLLRWRNHKGILNPAWQIKLRTNK